MASSQLLKEAIADAKAVRETAIANAKIALEEAFTPRLQSILSKKIQAEMEDMEGEEELHSEEEVELEEEYGDEDVSAADASGIGDGDNVEPEGDATQAHTELDPETEEETAEVGEEADETEVVSEEYEEEEMSEEDEFELDEEDEDELDLESIIRELEAQVSEEDENEDGVMDDPTGATIEEDEMEMDSEEPAMEEDEMEMEMDMEEDEELELDMEEGEDFDDTIDLDEILREMGYGDDEEVSEEEEEVHTEEEDEAAAHVAELEAELGEAYSTITSLRETINEVNLLNAKLLYANKLFRSYNLTNEQKIKVVENLDRTGTVREVKLVYATLAESMKFGGTERKVSGKKAMTEGLASKPVASTAPKREIISESNELANRFKELAGIINK